MLDEIIKSLSSNLLCIDYKIKDNQYIFTLQSSEHEVRCPYCNTLNSKTHSLYQREIQDLPIQDKQVILLISTRKVFCTNPECNHKTFAETFDFDESHGKRTKRLVSKILTTSTKLSSVSASVLLKLNSIKVGKSSICDLLKKNAIQCG
jgi:transposase|nr:transposase family protein [uncultured Lachnoclostridium sp.]